MTLRNGKFYDESGNVVPLEFGNKEQIDLLNRVESLRKEGEDVDIEYAVSEDGSRLMEKFYRIWCVCGCGVTFPFMGRYRTPAGKKIKCVCGMIYEGFDGDYGFAIRLIS